MYTLLRPAAVRVVSAGVGAAVIMGFFSHLFIVYASPAALVTSPFRYRFHADGTLDEAGSMADSWSPYWWVNSGAQLRIKNGIGQTIQGTLPAGYRWQRIYQAANPMDTDNGYRPQNVFRLVTRSQWHGIEQEVYFRIRRTNMTASPQRNASNGILLMSRYKEGGQTLYYAGLRVDGYAVIKKKINGVYKTLAYKPVFPLQIPYNVTANPNLMPLQAWMGLRSIVKNTSEGSVAISLLADLTGTGVWKEVASAIDSGSSGAVITDAGYAGIRTDFMDIEFDDYQLRKL